MTMFYVFHWVATNKIILVNVTWSLLEDFHLWFLKGKYLWQKIPQSVNLQIFFLQKLHRHQFKVALMGCVAFEMSILCVYSFWHFWGFSKRIITDRVLFFSKNLMNEMLIFQSRKGGYRTIVENWNKAFYLKVLAECPRTE